MLESGQQSQRLRWLLLGTFGGMLLLMSVAGIDALRSLRRLHRVSHQVAQRYSSHSQALETVLVCFHVYDESVEKYLLTDFIVANAPDRAEIARHGSDLHTAVSKYPRDSDNREQSLISQIDDAVKLEEAAFDDTQAWSSDERKKRVHVFIQYKVIPMRTQVLALASAVSQLNDQQLAAENEAVATEFLGLQTKLSKLVVITLLAGLVLSLVAGYYILRLEQDGRKRYLALERSREELEELSKRLVDVQEAERLSISRELHDEVGQTLGALLVDLGQLSSFTPPENAIVRDQIARIKAAAEGAVRSIRDIALLLRPPMLDDLGLIPALEWQARETSRRTDMEVDVHAGEMPDTLTDRVRVGIYRLVQEALQNAATHSRAKQVKVTVNSDRHRVEVEISDDGVGFQPERTRGMGILGMEERVRQLGGSFDLRSSPGKGTSVRAVLPIDSEDNV